MRTEYWLGNILGNVYLEYREGGRRITLERFLRRQVLKVVRMGGGWNCRALLLALFLGFCYQRVSHLVSQSVS
jgi:hypothetical protein